MQERCVFSSELLVLFHLRQVLGQLDEIRRDPKKFVCLNDNIDHRFGHDHITSPL
jgi:hypothetical protein